MGKNTPEGKTAFSNQCVNPKCKSSKNTEHGSEMKNGIHQSIKKTPIYCNKCKSLLPRPVIKDKKTNKLRLIMEWNKPAPTLTQNFQFEASDNKVHPSQNRVLSIYEALILQSMSLYDYKYIYKGKKANKNLMQDIIGESVPPKMIQNIVEKIIKIDIGKIKSIQPLLFEKVS